MAEDYYQVLGVNKTATAEEIQKAYRKLARKFHPDLADDKEKSKQQFQKIQHAYDVLGDEKKRKLYDQVGPNFESFQHAGAGGSPFQQSGGPYPQSDFDFSQIFGDQAGGRGGGGGGFEEILRQFGGFGGRGGRPKQTPPQKQDAHQEILIPFSTAILGGEYQLSLQRENGKVENLKIKIPIGIENGKRIRLRGQGFGENPASRGDLLVTVKVDKHPHFERRGNDLHLPLPVTLEEAVLGAKIDVPTPHGKVTVTVPPGSSSGRLLRLTGMGIKPANKTPGDIIAKLQILVPSDMNAEQRKLAEGFVKLIDQPNPRSQIAW